MSTIIKMPNSKTLPPLILLAAGKSSRMGFPKGLLEISGKTLLELHLENYFNIGGTEAYVILGSHLDKYFQKYPLLLEAQENSSNLFGGRVRVLINKQIPLGPFFSIQLGIKEIYQKEHQSCFIQPIDTPPASKEVFKSLKKTLFENIITAIPTFNNKGGHPILISIKIMSDLLGVKESDSDFRLDYQIKKLNKDLVKRVAVKNSSILLNLNRQKDLDNYLAHQS